MEGNLAINLPHFRKPLDPYPAEMATPNRRIVFLPPRDIEPNPPSETRVRYRSPKTAGSPKRTDDYYNTVA